MAQKRKTTSSKTQKKKTNGNSTKRKTKQAEIPAPVVTKDPYDEEPLRSPFENEILFYIIFAGCILLLLSNFGLIGAVGDFCSGVMFGLMGRMAYVFPVMILAIPFFQLKHIGNSQNRKLAAVLLMMIAICTFISLLATKGTGEMSPLGHYEYSKMNHEGGGFVGGIFTSLLVPAIGVVGCYIVDLLAMLIALVFFFHVTVTEFVSSRFGGYEIDFSGLNQKMRRAEKKESAESMFDLYDSDQVTRNEKKRDRSKDTKRPELKSISEGMKSIDETNLALKAMTPIDFSEIKEDEGKKKEKEPESPKTRSRGNTRERTIERTRRTTTGAPQTVDRIKRTTTGTPQRSPRRDHSSNRLNLSDFTMVANENGNYSDEMGEIRVDTYPADLDIHALSVKVEHKFENIPLDNTEHPRAIGSMQEIFPQEDYDPYAQTEELISQNVPAEQNDLWQMDEEARMYKAKTHYDPPRKHKNTEDDDYDYEEEDDDEEPNLMQMKTSAATGKAVDSDTASPEVRNQTEPVSILPPKPKYQMPPTSLLKKGKGPSGKNNPENTRRKLQETLDVFGVDARVTNYSCGPAVTRFEIEPQPGVKVSRIVNLADDIKLNLAATDIRIEAPIPGKSAVGIEVPNENKSAVAFRDLVESQSFKDSGSKLTFAVGKDIAGQVTVTDITKMPHLLIAGATGSGKSVCINTIIMSILYKAKPDEVKLIMIDPKVVELSVYNGIPHLMIPVVTDPKKAAGALSWAVSEMTDRYNKFAECHVRDIKGYNARIDQIDVPEGQKKPEKMFQIVIVVDELADLMMVASKEVEEYICRLAQLARACGIHLIIATQRPSVNVITGLIKANMPSRIAFAVTSSIDSRTILDMNGAEKLLGKGDMMFSPQGAPKPMRIQGAFISDDEVAEVVKFISDQKIADTSNQEVMKKIETMQSSGTTVSISGADSEPEGDPYFAEAGRIICDKQKASIGMLQRYLKVGFNRAARIMDQLQEADVVGPEEGTKPRTVLMSLEDFETYLNSL